MCASRLKVLAAHVWNNAHMKHWNLTNMVMTESPHWSVRFTIPGLSHESFDKDGNPSITSILKTTTVSRIYILNLPLDSTGKTLLDWSELMKDRLFFVASIQFKMSPLLYNPDVKKWPLDVDLSLGYVGNSSLVEVVSFYSTSEKSVPLWKVINQLVFVDKLARKPLALPDWFKSKYSNKGCLDKSFVVQPVSRPSITYSTPVTVKWSETDAFNHTSFISYVQWTVDSIHAALMDKEKMSKGDRNISTKSTLNGFNKDIVLNGIKEIQMSFFGESVEGETLDVHVWQEENFDCKILSSVERNDKKICHIQLEYFKT